MKNKANLPEKTVVQQGNDIVQSFYRMDAEQTNLFYYALAKIEKVFNPVKFLESYGKDNKTVVDFNDFKAQFSLSEMFESLNLPDTKIMRDLYYKKFVDMLKVVIKVESVSQKRFYPLYSEAVIGMDSKNKYASEICIIFNPLLFKNIFASRYTNGQLQVLGQLSRGSKNNYAQRLYFYLAMYRNTQGQQRYHNKEQGQWQVKISETYFRELVQMPKDEHLRKDSFRRMIKQQVQKINEKNFEFFTTVEFRKYGSEDMFFTCSENMQLKKLSKKDSTKERIEKLEINKQLEHIAYVRTVYRDEFDEIYQEELQQEVLFGSKEKTAEYNAYKRICQKKGIKEK